MYLSSVPLRPASALTNGYSRRWHGLVPTSAAWKMNGAIIESVHKAVMLITVILFKILKR